MCEIAIKRHAKGLCDKQTTRNVFKLLYDVTGDLYRSINHPRVLWVGCLFFVFFNLPDSSSGAVCFYVGNDVSVSKSVPLCRLQ